MSKQHNLANNQINELKASFDAFDKDGSGYISSKELQNVLNHLGIEANSKDFEELMNSMDKNDDGSISFAEFAFAMGKKFYQKKSTDGLLAEFKKYDTDNTGSVNAQEVLQVMKKNRGTFTLAQAQALVNKADKDGDGRINIAEFIQIIQS